MDRVSLTIGRKKDELEWPATLSTDDLRALGWKPLAFNQFILKVHSRCNMACDYCYLYSKDDTSWRDQPGAMSVAVAQRAADRIAEHVRCNEVDSISLVLHGGEPLLLGEARLEQLLEVFRVTLESIVDVHYRMQTNGLLLTDRALHLLANYNVEVGISLDGGQVENDRHRVTKSGGGTFDVVADRVRSLQDGPYSYLFHGFLATIDVGNDPIETYGVLRSFDPPHIDFLLPHGNWSSPPPHMRQRETPYADWLIRVFDHWFHSADDEPPIRYFLAIMRQLLGGEDVFEAIGLNKVRLVVIQTDGSYELVDSMKSVYDGAAATGLTIFDNDLDDVSRQPAVAVRQLEENELCSTCRACRFKQACGGGYIPHRYKRGTGYLNPSVYCRDLQKLIAHIQGRMGSVTSSCD